jgi:hypothetical protein
MKRQLLPHAIRQSGRRFTAGHDLMRILVATDAWPPQVNGVVRTLRSLARAAAKLGVTVNFLSPEGFPSFPVPTYPGLRLAWPSRRRIAERIEAAKPDAIHIATEGPIGFAVRSYCRRHGRHFNTSYTTRFPEYIAARSPIPQAWIYAALRRFHSAATVTMAATPSLMTELGARGFGNIGMWTRGVDVDLFHPDRAITLDFPRPIFVPLGRVAVEKNIDAFLALDLPGTCTGALRTLCDGVREGATIRMGQPLMRLPAADTVSPPLNFPRVPGRVGRARRYATGQQSPT